MTKIMQILNARKEGLIIGGIVGLGAAAWAISQGVSLQSIADAGKGLIDGIMSRSAPLEVAKVKVYILFTFTGALVGGIIDYAFDELGVARTAKRRR